uniref:HTH_48 domain-containing protein n=1 Tax=Caenorhabditis japonica TaxID=281687 RepID=A0A8R1E5Z6_CAEJA
MNNLSRPQLRRIIFYEWSCGTPAAETVTKIGKVFGETTVIDRTVIGSLVLSTEKNVRAVWIFRREEPSVQPNANLHEKKCLLSCFWDAKGMLYFELLLQERTVNATTYSNQLASLAIALGEKRPRRSAVHLLYDNARPHFAKATQEKTTGAELGHGFASIVLTRHRVF